MRRNGARISRRAREARAAGMLTSSQVARTLRFRTVAELDDWAEEYEFCADEWHHSGWDWKETDYWSPATIAEMKRVRAQKLTPAEVEAERRNVREVRITDSVIRSLQLRQVRHCVCPSAPYERMRATDIYVRKPTPAHYDRWMRAMIETF